MSFTLAARWRGAIALILASAAIGVSPAAAAVVPADCPMARKPFSAESPLFDLIANPRTKAILDRVIPTLVSSLPPFLRSTTTPSLTVIVSLRQMAAATGLPKEKVDEIDTALRELKPTAADDVLRCARYDETPPPPQPGKIAHPAILVFDHSTGFRDAPSVAAAAASLKTMAAAQGWHLVSTDKPGMFNARDLAKFDAVLWNNVSGDVLTLRQRAAFKRYIENGGGFVGIHGSGGDPLTFWDWYVDTLVGARFKGHPNSPQFQNGKLVVDDPKSPIVAGLGNGWSMTEEWYSFTKNPRTSGAHVLVTLDENSYDPREFGRSLGMGDHPIAWTRCVGKGRSFYSAIGHLPGSYTQPSAALLLQQGIAWAIRRDPAGCR